MKGEKTRRQEGWTAIDRRLPEADRVVLVHVPGRNTDLPVWVGFHDGKAWHELNGGWFVHRVTHWRDLPEPPRKTRSQFNRSKQRQQRRGGLT